MELHREAIVLDGHADTPQRFVDEGWDFAGPLGEGHVNLETAQTGGLTGGFLALWPEPLAWKGRYAERTLELLAATREQVRRHPEQLRLGTTAEDVRDAKREGKFCVLLGIEGGHAIENSLDRLRQFYALGVRYMTLTWSNSNEWADSSGDLDDAGVVHHGGLTGFGREVVAEMNRLGMMVDVSHVADSTFWDVMRSTRAPVIASHSCARSLCDAHRNLTDEQLRALAAADGVCGVNFYPGFLDDGWRAAWAATAGARERLLRARVGESIASCGEDLASDREFFSREFSREHRRVRFEVLLDHIEHVAAVAGPDHVGLGSDFDGFAILPEGIDSAADLPRITEGLAGRGWSSANLRKLLGENMLRVMERVQAIAG